MKYIRLGFNYGKFSAREVESLNSYKKDRLNSVLDSHTMYIDSDKLEIGRKKFKKDLLKHYNNLIKQIEEQI
jgi:hypothetical protein